MLTERTISIIGIILGSSLVAVAIAGEVTDCQTSVTREAGDLAHWPRRMADADIDGASVLDFSATGCGF
jgi:hypothetical protein